MITFNQSEYIVYEDRGMVQLLLSLSKPSSTNLTVQVNHMMQKGGSYAKSELQFLNICMCVIY